MSARPVAFMLFSLLVLASAARADDAYWQRHAAVESIAYPVADLVVPVVMDHTKPPPARATTEAELMDLLCRMCAPRSWRCAGGVGTMSYHAKNMRLVVQQTAPVHAQIAHVLEELRRLQDLEVALETRLVTVSAERARALERAAEGTKFGRLLPADGVDGVCLSERECFLLFSLLQEDRNTSIHQTPKVTMFSGQKCPLSITDQVARLPGDVDDEGRPLAGPQVNVGFRQVLQPVIEHERRSVRLYVSAATTELVQGTKPGRVLRTRRLEHVFRIPDGQTLIAKLGCETAKDCQYLLLTPRIVVNEEEEIVVNEEQQTPRPMGAAAPPRRVRSTAAATNAANAAVRRMCIMPVGDLITPIAVEGQSWLSHVSQMPGFCSGDERSPQAALMRLITTTVAPETWQGRGGAGKIDFYPVGQALVVNQTIEIQEEVHALLQAVRRLQELRVGLECRLVTLPDAVAKRISNGQSRAAIHTTATAPRRLYAGFEEQELSGSGRSGAVPPTKALLPIPMATEGLPMLALKPQDAGRLRRLLAEEEQKLEHKLAGIGWNGQRLRLDARTSKTMTVEVSATSDGERVVVTPKTRTFQRGALIDAVPVLSADRESVRIELRIELSGPQTTTPRKVKLTVDGRESEHLVSDVPIFGTREVRTTVQMGKTETLVLSLGRTPADERSQSGVAHLAHWLLGSSEAGEESQAYLILTPRVYEH